MLPYRDPDSDAIDEFAELGRQHADAARHLCASRRVTTASPTTDSPRSKCIVPALVMRRVNMRLAAALFRLVLICNENDIGGSRHNNQRSPYRLR